MHRGIPVTTPVQTLADIAPLLAREPLERAVNEAVNRDLTEPGALRTAICGMRGARPLAALLDEHTFILTDTVLEQRVWRIARKAGLSKPLTQVYVNGFRVDFYWPELGIVLEADSLRFHRTPSQQARDRLRDRAHIAAGLIPLRFTHWQIAREEDRLVALLGNLARRAAA